MKVICINDKWDNPDAIEGRPKPVVGEECEVVYTEMIYLHSYYQLGGKYHKNSRFITTSFALVSDIDETTFERNYSTSLK